MRSQPDSIDFTAIQGAPSGDPTGTGFQRLLGGAIPKRVTFGLQGATSADITLHKYLPSVGAWQDVTGAQSLTTDQEYTVENLIGEDGMYIGFQVGSYVDDGSIVFQVEYD